MKQYKPVKDRKHFILAGEQSIPCCENEDETSDIGTSQFGKYQGMLAHTHAHSVEMIENRLS